MACGDDLLAHLERLAAFGLETLGVLRRIGVLFVFAVNARADTFVLGTNRYLHKNDNTGNEKAESESDTVDHNGHIFHLKRAYSGFGFVQLIASDRSHDVGRNSRSKHSSTPQEGQI